jgi:hypothetical protein
MDWDKIKETAADFDAILSKQKTPDECCEHAQIMLAALMYCDAKWIAELPKNERKAALQQVYEPFRDDVAEMAKMIVRGLV